MTARVLVVDDIPSNVMLLKAQLSAQYFEVQTAANGLEALAKIEKDPPDVVLLDVMMPGLTGYEVCKRVRRMPETASLPIIMVTALDMPNDRIAGFEAGADDFLTKPVNGAMLLARVRGLVRLKLLTDELQQRQSTARSMGAPDPVRCLTEPDPTGRILAVDDRQDTIAFLRSALGDHKITPIGEMEAAVTAVNQNDFDLAMVSLSIHDFDGLRLCSRIRATAKGRHLPILAIARDDQADLAKAFELGVNDCILRPLDKSELVARTKWLLRKKRYTDQLQESLALSLNMATVDQLTGLYNRRFMDRRLELLIERSHTVGEPLTLMVFDIDHFKGINDRFGHDIGDEVLRSFAAHLSRLVRTSDLVCRYGGEEFVVLMRDATREQALAIAERVRALLESTPIAISRAPGNLSVTVSVGLATSTGQDDTAGAIFHRADQALYRAKNSGRNRVCEELADASAA
jgi:two-component system cell cycle response regulator